MSASPAMVVVPNGTLIHSSFARRGDPGAYWRPADLFGSGVGPIHSNKVVGV